MLSTLDRYVIARENNVVLVDFSHDPDPPAPCFPGANGLRVSDAECDSVEAAAESQNLAGHLELWGEATNSVR